jgi:hypothetical protein
MPPRRSSGGGRKRKADQVAPSQSGQAQVLKVRYVDKDDISDNLKCSICQDVFSYPIALMCGHVYCDGCIRDWIRTARPGTCPECRMLVDLRMTHRDMIAHKFLDSLPVYCAYLGCPWIGRMDEHSGHAKSCEFDPARLPAWMVSKTASSSLSNVLDDELPAEGTTSLRMRLFGKDKELMGSAAAGKINIFSINNSSPSRGSSAVPIQSVEELTSDLIRSEDIINRNADAFIDISSDDGSLV